MLFAMECKDAGCLCCEKYANRWGPLLRPPVFWGTGDYYALTLIAKPRQISTF